jgi:hypothetical protein
VLGSQWEAVRPTILVLAIAAPWRMVLGQAGAVALAARRSRALVSWQAIQMVCFACGLGAVAAGGDYAMFVTSVAVGWIVAVTAIEHAAARSAGIAGWTRLGALGWSAGCVARWGGLPVSVGRQSTF